MDTWKLKCMPLLRVLDFLHNCLQMSHNRMLEIIDIKAPL